MCNVFSLFVTFSRITLIVACSDFPPSFTFCLFESLMTYLLLLLTVLTSVWFRRLSKDPGQSGLVHLGKKPGQHQLRGGRPSWSECGLVQRWLPTAERQHHQREDLQHADSQLPRGDAHLYGSLSSWDLVIKVAWKIIKTLLMHCITSWTTEFSNNSLKLFELYCIE